MMARTKFLKWYYKLPKEARADLVWKPYDKQPMSIGVVWCEVQNKTKIGDIVLKEMGWADDS